MSRFIYFFALLAPLLLRAQPAPDLMEITANEAQLSTIMMLLVADREVGEMLKSSGPYTLFAPTNDAFNELGAVGLNALTAPGNEGQLRNLLLGLIAHGRIELRESRVVPTLNGNRLKVIVEEDTIRINDAHLDGPTFNAANGVLYPIDRVPNVRTPAPQDDY